MSSTWCPEIELFLFRAFSQIFAVAERTVGTIFSSPIFLFLPSPLSLSFCRRTSAIASPCNSVSTYVLRGVENRFVVSTDRTTGRKRGFRMRRRFVDISTGCIREEVTVKLCGILIIPKAHGAYA